MSMISACNFGLTSKGAPVTRFTLWDGPCSAVILDYGGAVQALSVPDRRGRPVDVVLGFDDITAYERQDKFLGALIGRCANRIGGGTFRLNGRTYTLPRNDGPNHLHGGLGFDRRVWSAQVQGSALRLTLHSPDGDQGYPGALDAAVTYRLEGQALIIDYEAVSDGDTLCNLTNHTYFNLSGHGSGPVLDQRIQLFASAYTPADAGSIPTGELAPVAGTPMDLRESRPIGADIDGGFRQLRLAQGFDHNWAVDGPSGILRPAARAYSEATGIGLLVETTLPGIQFYSGNHLDGCPAGKGGAPYDRRWGFCLETQFYPDAVHHPNFPQPILLKGERYAHRTVFRFDREGAIDRRG